MAIVKQSKVIAQLPSVLEPDCLYYVRVGQGFDLYLTDHTGSIAYKSNVDDIVTSNLNRLDKTGRNSVSEELENVIKLCKDNNLPLSSNVQATFLLTRDLNLRELTVDLPNVTFILQHSETTPPKVILGGNSNSAFNPSQVVGKILSSTFSMADLNPRNRNHISCRIIGAKGQNISISQCDYLQLFCSTDIKDRSIAYCNFNFDFTVKLEITTDSNNPDNLELWCNENNFYLKRGYALDVTGSYRHNCNLFIGGGFENRYGYINLESAAKNRFLHTRLEGIGQITFGTNSEGNVIERAYYGSTNSLGIIPVTDNGVMNRISTLSLENSVKTRVFEINEQTPKWNTSVIFPNVLVSEYIKTNKTWSLIYNSPIFKMKGREDYLIADWDNTRARYLIVVEFFDEIGNKIDPSKINFNSPFLTYQANKQWLQGNHLGGQTYGTRNFTIMTPGEYNVRVGIYSNSKLEEQLSKRFTVDLYSNRPISVPKLEDTLSDIPTQFIGQVGSSVSLLDGRTVSCTGIKSGEISGFDFNRTEKYITVRNGNTSIKSNAIIEIKNEDGSIVWTRVLKIAGTNSIVLENTEGITNPISYKCYNLEYSQIQQDDTSTITQQLESIVAVNRQFEERLNTLSNNSNNVITSFEEGARITTRIVEDGFELCLENAENEEIVLSILSVDGVTTNEEVVISSSTSYKLKYKDITSNDIRTKLNLQWLQTPVIEFEVKAVRHHSNKIKQSYIRYSGSFSQISQNSDNPQDYQNSNLFTGGKFACYSIKILNDLNVLINSSNLHTINSWDDKIIRLIHLTDPSVSKTNIDVNPTSIFLVTDLESLETELFYPTKNSDLNKYLGKSIRISMIVDNLTVHEYEYDYSPVPIEEALKLRVYNNHNIISPVYKDGHNVTFVTNLDNTEVIYTFSDNGDYINYYTGNYHVKNNYRYSSSNFERNKNNITTSYYHGFENFILGKTYSDLKLTINELKELLSRNTNGIKIYVFGITDIDGVGDVKFSSYSSLYSILENKTKNSVTPMEQYRDFFENTPICIEYTITDSIVGEDNTLTSSTFRRITIKEFFDKFFQSAKATDNSYGP